MTTPSDYHFGVKRRSLIAFRWAAVLGQVLTVAVVGLVLDFSLPWPAILALVAASVAANLALGLQNQKARLDEKSSLGYFCFDILQLTGLLFFTGGLQNPFASMFLIYVTYAAAVLSPRFAWTVAGLAVSCLTLLAFLHQPLPWRDGGLLLERLYSCGVWAALTVATLFATSFISRLTMDHRQMAGALSISQSALAKEQELATAFGLAAAAAHQLGTPLNTIALIAKDLQQEAAQNPRLAPDAQLLSQQTDQCRKILHSLSDQAANLSQKGEAAQPLSIAAMLEWIASPWRDLYPQIKIGLDIPGFLSQNLVIPRPELAHGLNNILQNAAQHARQNVFCGASLADGNLRFSIQDDGAGFPSELLRDLGEPYVQKNRRAKDGSKQGLGLGIFIAKNLVEKLGGSIDFGNGLGGGALVLVNVPLAALAPQAKAAA